MGMTAIALCAFAGAMVSSVVVLLFSRMGLATPKSIILVGVALSALWAGASTIMQYFSDEHDRAVVAAAIERLELEPFVDRYCDELSGGERQKVYIARAIAQQNEALLLDEPTSALDPKNQMEVLQVVRDITTQMSLATVMVIHDANLALRFCDKFVLMRNGTIVAQGGIEAVTDEALSETYDMPMRIAEIDNVKMTIPTAS